MPRAPEYSQKEQKQRDRQDAKEAHEKGARQAFPGAPIWNDYAPNWGDYYNQQRQAKKRQVGRTRRFGRAAVETLARSVLIAKETPRAVTEARHKNLAQKAQRLQKVVDRSNSAEAIPTTDLRKVEKSKLRRLGRGILSVANRTNRNALQNTTQRTESLAAKSSANRQAKPGPVEAWASTKLSTIESKRQATLSRRSNEFYKLEAKQKQEFETDKQVAWNKYLAENPEVKQRLIAEQEQRDELYEINSQDGRYREMQSNASHAAEYFVKRSSYSFSKAIPRRPGFEGSYDELARSSVERAAQNRQEDGSIALFNRDLLFGIVVEKMPLSPDGAQRDGPVIFDGETRHTSRDFYNNDRQLFNDVQERSDYVGGVATSLWKMGFVEFDTEADIAGGGNKGHRMNEAIEWSRGEDGTTFASLAYNPENELHRIIAGDQADLSNARVQLAIGGQQYAPEMSVNLVEQPALVHAA